MGESDHLDTISAGLNQIAQSIVCDPGGLKHPATVNGSRIPVRVCKRCHELQMSLSVPAHK